MSTRSGPDTEELLQAVGRGRADARGQLLERHRERLRRMVAVRIDRRLSARIDPSDIVQESLVEAASRLSAYVRERPLPFYPWLRRIATDRLTDASRKHVRAGRRSVGREQPLQLSSESVMELAERLLARSSAPSARLHRYDLNQRVRAALSALPERDREVLVLRYLEDLPTSVAAAVMGIGESAVKMRLLRALERLRRVLHEEGLT